MAITRHFKGSTDKYGYGYFGYIEDGQLVLGENWPREGGIIYRGTFEGASHHLTKLVNEAPKLYNSITKYYADVQKVTADRSPITHRFKDSRDSHGNGYSAYIEDGQLVLEYWDPRSGGTYYRGDYWGAIPHLKEIKKYDKTLYNDIEKYFIKHGVEDSEEQIKKKYGFDEATKTVLFKVQLYMDNRQVHNALVRGRSQSGVVEKLMPRIPEVLMLQTLDAREFAVRSDKIYAVEFMED